ncbi:MAG: hypothetical protein R3F59_38755 [Myxococcota bacterium]
MAPGAVDEHGEAVGQPVDQHLQWVVARHPRGQLDGERRAVEQVHQPPEHRAIAAQLACAAANSATASASGSGSTATTCSPGTPSATREVARNRARGALLPPRDGGRGALAHLLEVVEDDQARRPRGQRVPDPRRHVAEARHVEHRRDDAHEVVFALGLGEVAERAGPSAVRVRA